MVSNDCWREGLFEKFEKLIEIRVCGVPFHVPENNRLLRCFQYARMEAVSIGDYCWNGDCDNCQIDYVGESGEVKRAMACKLYARAGMVILDVSAELRGDLLGEEPAIPSVGI